MVEVEMEWRVVRAGFETVRVMFWREKSVFCLCWKFVCVLKSSCESFLAYWVAPSGVRVWGRRKERKKEDGCGAVYKLS